MKSPAALLASALLASAAPARAGLLTAIFGTAAKAPAPPPAAPSPCGPPVARLGSNATHIFLSVNYYTEQAGDNGVLGSVVTASFAPPGAAATAWDLPAACAPATDSPLTPPAATAAAAVPGCTVPAVVAVAAGVYAPYSAALAAANPAAPVLSRGVTGGGQWVYRRTRCSGAACVKGNEFLQPTGGACAFLTQTLLVAPAKSLLAQPFVKATSGGAYGWTLYVTRSQPVSGALTVAAPFDVQASSFAVQVKG